MDVCGYYCAHVYNFGVRGEFGIISVPEYMCKSHAVFQNQVSATYGDGYRCMGVCTVVGPKAVEKAHRVAEAILSRSATPCAASTVYISPDSAIVTLKIP